MSVEALCIESVLSQLTRAADIEWEQWMPAVFCTYWSFFIWLSGNPVSDASQKFIQLITSDCFSTREKKSLWTRPPAWQILIYHEGISCLLTTLPWATLAYYYIIFTHDKWWKYKTYYYILMPHRWGAIKPDSDG